MRTITLSALLLVLGNLVFAQSHQVSFVSGFHYNEQNFYLPKASMNTGTKVPSGLIKFSFGARYDMLFQDKSSWLISFRGDYAYRSFITEYTIGGAPMHGMKHNAEFVDLLLGVGKQLYLNEGLEAGFTIAPGVGLPLQKKVEGNSVTRPNFINVDHVQAFIEMDLNLTVLYARKQKKAWFISFSPFVRGYLEPLYERGDHLSDEMPFFGLGAKVRLGLRFL